MQLALAFYQRDDVTLIARELLGMVLCTRIGDTLSAGRIVETEAYSHLERGCHAYGGKATQRNAVMFEPGGCAYVYLCYGMHHLFNVVTNKKGVAEAVLIRALQPVEGLEHMLDRTGKSKPLKITSGPGKLTKAMGINRTFNGKMLKGSDIWVARDGHSVIAESAIVASPRIGIDYAGEDAKLPWRFTVKDDPWLSK